MITNHVAEEYHLIELDRGVWVCHHIMGWVQWHVIFLFYWLTGGRIITECFVLRIN